MRGEGGCFCGAIRYQVTGEPLMVVHCHCVHCRRTNAAAMVTRAEYPQHHVWVDRKLSWVELDDGLPQHALRRS